MLGLSGDSPQSISVGYWRDMGDTTPQLTPMAPKLNVFPRNLGQATKPVVVLQSFLQLLGKPCHAKAEWRQTPDHLHRVFGGMGDTIPQLTPIAPKLSVFPRSVGHSKDFCSAVWSSLPLRFCRRFASWQRHFDRSAAFCRSWTPICG